MPVEERVVTPGMLPEAIGDFDIMYHSMVDEKDVIKVTGAANPRAIATSIDYAFQRHNEVVVRAMGAAAVNQAAKGVAIARGVVAPGLWTWWLGRFTDRGGGWRDP
jgi:stage V sporulation protein SpoVS